MVKALALLAPALAWTPCLGGEPERAGWFVPPGPGGFPPSAGLRVDPPAPDGLLPHRGALPVRPEAHDPFAFGATDDPPRTGPWAWEKRDCVQGEACYGIGSILTALLHRAVNGRTW